MNKLKKIVSLCLIGVMTISNITPVLAYDDSLDVPEYYTGTLVGEPNNGYASMSDGSVAFCIQEDNHFIDNEAKYNKEDSINLNASLNSVFEEIYKSNKAGYDSDKTYRIAQIAIWSILNPNNSRRDDVKFLYGDEGVIIFDAMVKGNNDSFTTETHFFVPTDNKYQVLITGESIPTSDIHIHVLGDPVKENVDEATCQKSGSYDKVYYCKTCGEEISREKITTGKLEHTPGEPVQEDYKEATCKDEGFYNEVIKCSKCGAEISRLPHTIGKLEHVWDNGKITKEATCEQKGEKTFTCDNCGTTRIEYIDKTEHTPGQWEVSDVATCQKEGLKVKKCTICGTILESASIEKTNHVAGTPERKNEIPASCEKDGSYDTVVSCKNCGKELAKTTTTIQASGHKWNDGVITKSATCIAEGERTFTCDKCQATKTEPISKTAHKGKPPVQENIKEATCTEGGSYEEVVYCAGCNQELSRTLKTTSKTGHIAAEPVRENVKEATYTTEGSYDEVIKCSKCGVELSREKKTLGKLNHTHTGKPAIQENKIDSTCSKEGSYEEVVYCSICDAEMSRTTKTIPKKEHTYRTEVTEPTCTKGGFTTHICTVCGNEYTDNETQAKGHKWNDGVITTPATCDKEGVKTFTCLTCSATKTKPVNKIAHTPGEKRQENKVEPSCEKTGSYVEVTYCKNCNAEISRENKTIPKLGHDYKAVVTEPTCTKGGFTTHSCSRCDSSYVDAETSALGHKPGEPVQENVKPATATENGSYDEVVYCATCGAEISREQKVIEKVAHTHTPAAAVQENVTAPKCEKDGSYESVVYCSECGEELSRETKVATRLGHDYKTTIVPPSCEEDGYTLHKCSRCNSEYKDNYKDALDHDVDDWEIEEEPTCQKKGKKILKCQRCGLVFEEDEIMTIPHNYVDGVCSMCGNELPGISVTAKGWHGIYDGKPHSIEVISAGNTIEYSLDNATFSSTNPSFTEVGTYTVYYKVTKSGFAPRTGSKEVEIEEAKSVITKEPAAKTLTYNKSEQELITEGTATNGTIQYKLGNGSYSTSIPKAKDAGEYTVYYKVIGDENYTGIDEQEIKVTIEKANGYINTKPEGKLLKCSSEAQELVVAGKDASGEIQYKVGDNGEYSAAIPTATEVDSYTIYYKVLESKNYKAVAEDSVSTDITHNTTIKYENEVASTDTKPGTVEEVACCSNCDAEFNRRTVYSSVIVSKAPYTVSLNNDISYVLSDPEDSSVTVSSNNENVATVEIKDGKVVVSVKDVKESAIITIKSTANSYRYNTATIELKPQITDCKGGEAVKWHGATSAKVPVYYQDGTETEKTITISCSHGYGVDWWYVCGTCGMLKYVFHSNYDLGCGEMCESMQSQMQQQLGSGYHVHKKTFKSYSITITNK